MKTLPHPDPADFMERLEEALAEQAPHARAWAGVLSEFTAEPRYEDESPVAAVQAEMTRDSDKPWVNFLASTANTIVPSLLARHPHIMATPTRADLIPAAKAHEAAASHLSRKVGVLPVVQECVLDSMLYGVGILKVGWDDPNAGAITVPDYEDGANAQEDESPLDGMKPEVAERVRRVLEENDVPVAAAQRLPTVRRVAPWNFVIAPGAASPAESPWVAERLLVTDDDLRDVPFFKVPKDAAPDTVLSSGPNEQYNPHAPRVPHHHTVWEIRYWSVSRKGRQRRTVWIRVGADGTSGAQVLAHIEEPSKCPGWPYEYLQAAGAAGTWYRTKTADLPAIRELAARLNALWHYILAHHRRNSKRKYIFGPGFDEEKLKELLESDEDLAGAQANTDDVRNAVAILPEAPMPADTGMVLQGLRSLMYEVSGMDAFQRGALPTNTTATAANLTNQGTQGRLAYRLAKVEEFYACTVRRVLGYFSEFADQDLVARVAGPDGPEFLSYPRGTYGYGDFDIEIEVGSTMPRDPRSQQQNFLLLLQAIQQTIVALAPAVEAGALPKEAISGFITRAFDLWREDPEFFMGPVGELAATLMQKPPQAGPAMQGGPPTPQGLEGAGAAPAQPFAPETI